MNSFKICLIIGILFVGFLLASSVLFHPHLYMVANMDWIFTLVKVLFLAGILIGIWMYVTWKLAHWGQRK